MSSMITWMSFLVFAILAESAHRPIIGKEWQSCATKRNDTFCLGFGLLSVPKPFMAGEGCFLTEGSCEFTLMIRKKSANEYWWGSTLNTKNLSMPTGFTVRVTNGDDTDKDLQLLLSKDLSTNSTSNTLTSSISGLKCPTTKPLKSLAFEEGSLIGLLMSTCGTIESDTQELDMENGTLIEVNVSSSNYSVRVVTDMLRLFDDNESNDEGILRRVARQVREYFDSRDHAGYRPRRRGNRRPSYQKDNATDPEVDKSTTPSAPEPTTPGINDGKSQLIAIIMLVIIGVCLILGTAVAVIACSNFQRAGN